MYHVCSLEEGEEDDGEEEESGEEDDEVEVECEEG